MILFYFQLFAVDSAYSGVSSGPYCIGGNKGPSSAFFFFFFPFFFPSAGSGDSVPAGALSSAPFFFFFPFGYGKLAITSSIFFIELLGPK